MELFNVSCIEESLPSINEQVDMDTSFVSICPIMSDASTQTEITMDHLKMFDNNELQNEKKMKRKIMVEAVLDSNESCMFWTGIPKLSVLMFIFDWILPCAKNVKLWLGNKNLQKQSKYCSPKKRMLSLFEEFILTLIKIRRGFDNEETGHLLGVSKSHVSHVFITWVNLLHDCTKPLLEWPTAEMIRFNLPKSFKKHFPETRIIIDCSEVFVQKPRSVAAQRLTYSTYKSHNTFKFLLGIAPNGQVTFLSKLYSGSISDRRIVLKSGFIEKLEAGDNVMADRGFNIRDLLLKKNAKLNMPAFSGGKQLTAGAVLKSRRIASVRIHVERAMKRLKNFKILQGTIPLKLKNSMDQILVIIAVLGNLSDPLVKR